MSKIHLAMRLSGASIRPEVVAMLVRCSLHKVEVVMPNSSLLF